MPYNLTDNDAFTDPVPTVADGDAANASEFARAPQALANRTRRLHNRLNALTAAKTVKRCVPISVDGTLGGWDLSNLGNWTSNGNFAILVADISEALEHGASLTSVTVRVLPGAVRSTVGNRMRLVIRRRTQTGTTTDLVVTGDFRDDGTSTSQYITATPDAPHTIDRETGVYQALILAGNDGGTNNDIVTGLLQCECAVPAITYP